MRLNKSPEAVVYGNPLHDFLLSIMPSATIYTVSQKMPPYIRT